MMSPGEVLADVDPEEPEAADSLYLSLIDGNGGVSFSLSLPVVHNQLHCFADIEMEVVVLMPLCQGCDLLSVGHLVVIGDQADDVSIVRKLNDDVGAIGGHAVMCEQGEQEGAEHTALSAACVESEGGGCGGAFPYCLGSAHQEVQDSVAQGGVEFHVSELDDKLWGHNGIEC